MRKRSLWINACWLTPAASPGHSPAVSWELALFPPAVTLRTHNIKPVFILALPLSQSHYPPPAHSSTPASWDTFQLNHRHPTPFSGSALGRVQTKMGHVAGDPERGKGALWHRHCPIEKAHISEYLLQARRLTGPFLFQTSILTGEM